MNKPLSLLHPDALPPGRWLVALLVGLAVTAFHAAHGLQLGNTVLLQSFNWLFDFDSSRFTDDWCNPAAEGMPHVGGVSFATRHALSVPTRALCLALAPLAADPGSALMLLTALCAGVAAAVAYALAASFCAEEFDRVLVAVAFAVSVQPLMLGVIPETYGFAMMGIGVSLALLARRGDSGLGAGFAAAFALFLNLGFTITNAVLNIVASAVLQWRRMPLRTWLAMETKVWLMGGIALVALTAVAAAYFEPSLLGTAGSAPKKVWWIVNIERGEPASLLMVLCTFFLYSFVAPVFTVINLPAPDSHPMLDFRALQFTALGWAALVLWAGAFLLSIWLAWRGGQTRRLLLVVAGWMLCNIVLHWYWQYRGSVYLYGAHTCFVLFMVLAMGYGAALRQYATKLVRGYAVALVVLCGLNNYGAYQEMIGFVLQQPLSP